MCKLMRRLKAKLAYFSRVARFVEMIFFPVLHETRQPWTSQFLRDAFLHGACKEERSEGFHYTFLQHLTALECLLMQFKRSSLPLLALNFKSDVNF